VVEESKPYFRVNLTDETFYEPPFDWQEATKYDQTLRTTFEYKRLSNAPNPKIEFTVRPIGQSEGNEYNFSEEISNC